MYQILKSVADAIPRESYAIIVMPVTPPSPRLFRIMDKFTSNANRKTTIKILTKSTILFSYIYFPCIVEFSHILGIFFSTMKRKNKNA